MHNTLKIRVISLKQIISVREIVGSGPAVNKNYSPIGRDIFCKQVSNTQTKIYIMHLIFSIFLFISFLVVNIYIASMTPL